MRIRTILAVWFVVAACATIALTQSRPKFAGTWTLESSTPKGVAVVSASQLVKQDDATLTVGHSERDHHTTTYKLDGQEHADTVGPVTFVSKATWDGATLVIDRTDTLPTGTSRTMRQIWALDASDKLTVKLTDTIQGKAPVTMTNVYIRK